MRLLTDLPLPDLEDRLATCVPGVELIHVDTAAGAPENLRAAGRPGGR